MWSKIVNVFRRERLNRELDEELQSHLDEAIEQGRNADEARRAFGSALHHRESSRDLKLISWLDALRADVVFGWRQLLKNRIASAAGVLSLGLAIGACVSAFRLIDALLLRPLPVQAPERLHYLTVKYTDNAGKVSINDAFEFPHFLRLRAAVKGDAELMAISFSARMDVTYGSDQEMEKAYRQFISGWTFSVFGLRPALGRLLTANDDSAPGAHPYAVLSYDYWQRRFGRDPNVLGRTLRIAGDQYEIVGVLERRFTGTEPGTLTDIFTPMSSARGMLENATASWFRTWIQIAPSVKVDVVRQKLQAAMRAFREEQAKGNKSMPAAFLEKRINAPLSIEPAAAGVSSLQSNYGRSLAILGVLVALLLLIACANIANLKTAQVVSRSREMALRVSIGAGRARLVQLVLVESALVALLASGIGALFAWCAAPFVVGAINPPDNPARLILPADWRVMGFAALLALGITFVFGLMPALQAFAVKPANVLKGGDDPHGRRRWMNATVAAQVAFCLIVQLVAGLFVSSFDRLSRQPMGFAAERLLLLDVFQKTPQPVAHWDEVLERLRNTAGVESAALSAWPLMSGALSRAAVIVDGTAPSENSLAFRLSISPGWLATMKIPMIAGRDFRASDADPQVAIVNQEFAKIFFGGQNPVGRSFEIPYRADRRARLEIVGYARDALYTSMREPIRPTFYVPFVSETGKSGMGTFVLRATGDNPLAMAPFLRKELPRIYPEFRVRNVHTQRDLVEAQTVRERLLAMLALFFGVVSLVLASVGLFGVLDCAVQQRRREIGIRIALGARPAHVASRVTVEVFAMVLLGAVAGLGAGVASERYIASLLYQVKATDLVTLALPLLIILGAALLAALPPVMRAVRIDPAKMLRAD